MSLCHGVFTARLNSCELVPGKAAAYQKLVPANKIPLPERRKLFSSSCALLSPRNLSRIAPAREREMKNFASQNENTSRAISFQRMTGTKYIGGSEGDFFRTVAYADFRTRTCDVEFAIPFADVGLGLRTWF